MQVGKMLIDSSNFTRNSATFHNSRPNTLHNDHLSVPSGNNLIRGLSKHPADSPYNNFSKRVFGNEENGWDSNSLNRKNIKSLSPPRRN